MAVGVSDPPDDEEEVEMENDRDDDDGLELSPPPMPYVPKVVRKVAPWIILGFRYFWYSRGISAEISLSNENTSKISGGKMEMEYRVVYKL